MAPSRSGHARVQPAPGQRIYFVSLGCPKNQVDTELMLGQVQAAGHTLVDAPEAADVIVVNTCAFIDAAKEESVDTILEMAQHKAAGAQKLVVTGCLAQRYAGELAKDIPEIDHILGSSDFPAIASALAAPSPAPRTGARPGAKKKKPLPVIQVAETPRYIYDHDAPRVRIGA
ncbi:MAG: 30S ribosomal protein S12 methylthiotransferase RimO, partial [Solirubrobacteraceae bacterium]